MSITKTQFIGVSEFATNGDYYSAPSAIAQISDDTTWCAMVSPTRVAGANQVIMGCLNAAAFLGWELVQLAPLSAQYMSFGFAYGNGASIESVVFEADAATCVGQPIFLHVVYNANGAASTLTAYINGQIVATNTGDPLANSALPLYVGSQPAVASSMLTASTLHAIGFTPNLFTQAYVQNHVNSSIRQHDLAPTVGPVTLDHRWSFTEMLRGNAVDLATVPDSGDANTTYDLTLTGDAPNRFVSDVSYASPKIHSLAP